MLPKSVSRALYEFDKFLFSRFPALEKYETDY